MTPECHIATRSPPSLRPLCDRQSFSLRDAYFAEDVRQVTKPTENLSAVEHVHLGSAARQRDGRFIELSELWNGRVERPPALDLRPQIDAIINLLEPNEPVADMTLGNVRDENEPEHSLRGVLRDLRNFRDDVAMGVIALTPRRLIHAPRNLNRVPVRIVQYRDIIDLKSTAVGPVLALRQGNVRLNINAPRKTIADLLSFMDNRRHS